MARLSPTRIPMHGSRGIRVAAGVIVAGIILAALIPVSDVALYRSYGAGLFHSHLPAEYPLGAALLFWAPTVLPIPYAVGFAVLMIGALVAVLAVGRRIGGGSVGSVGGWDERFLCYVALGAVAVVFTRFDLAPALCVLLAVQGARGGRWRSAWIWALIGTAVKVFPVLLLPGFFLAEKRRTGRAPWGRTAAAAGAMAAFSALQQLVAPGTVLRPLSYELHRGFEFSSVPGTLTLLAAPAHAMFGFAFGNHQITGGGPTTHAVIGALMLLAAAAGLVGVWLLTARGALPVEAASLAVITLAVLTGKALAPQYLLWLAPLWAYWRLRPSWLAASAVTTLVFPVLFIRSGGSLYLDTVVAGVRNALLVGGSVAWFWEGMRNRWGPGVPAPAPSIERTEVLPCPA